MPKVKPKRHLPVIDMTAMVDVAFLLLTFFILTTKFKTEDKVEIEPPSSISETALPNQGIMTVSVDNEGRVFVGFANMPVREKVIQQIAADYNMRLTEDQIKFFSLQAQVGVPFKKMESWLKLENDPRNEYEQEGVPYPFNTEEGEDNELKRWIKYGRTADVKTTFGIKGDQDAPYEAVRDVIDTFQDWNINKFNLVTSLEGVASEAEAAEEEN